MVLIFIPFKVKIFLNLDYYKISFSRFIKYKKYYKEIKDINKEKNIISYYKIFKFIDIQKINLSIGGIDNYYYQAILIGLSNFIFNIFSFIKKDPFIFDFNLNKNDSNIEIECIIKSNMGKILLGLIKKTRSD